MLTSVTITHLQMFSRDRLRPRPKPRPDVAVDRVAEPSPEINRFFYIAIGGDWHWRDRLPWSDADWKFYVERPAFETWVVRVGDDLAGFFELERQSGGDVEIVYFGLLPAFVGNGLGGWALSEAIDRAWAGGANRVWVHTCDLDHPAALGNYLARGFEVYKAEVTQEDLPDVVPHAMSAER